METKSGDYNHINQIKEYIEEDIKAIKRKKRRQIVTSYIGELIKEFIEKYKDYDNETFTKFQEEVSGLEKKINIKKGSLHNLLLSGFDIEEILRQRGEELAELEEYACELAKKA
jgi:hypothetical protein